MAPAWLLLAYGLAFLLHRFLYLGLRGPQGDGGVLYAAAAALRLGADPWDIGQLRRIAIALGVTWDAAAGLGPEFWADTQNVNPPGLLALLVPWSLLPVSLAVPLLVLVNTACVGIAAWLLYRLARPAHPLAWLGLILATFTPLYRAQVQITLPLLVAFLGGCLLWRSGRSALAGVCLSTLLFRPPLGALALLALLAMREWRAAVWMAATGALLTVAAVPFVGIDAVAGYFLATLPTAGSGINALGGGADWNISTLRFLVESFGLTGTAGNGAASIGGALLVGATALLAWRRLGDVLVPISLALVVAMLVAYSRDYYHLLALPLVVVLAGSGVSRRELALLALVYAALAYDSYFPQPVIRAYKPAALLGLWAYGAFVAWRWPRQSVLR